LYFVNHVVIIKTKCIIDAGLRKKRVWGISPSKGGPKGLLLGGLA